MDYQKVLDDNGVDIGEHWKYLERVLPLIYKINVEYVQDILSGSIIKAIETFDPDAGASLKTWITWVAKAYSKATKQKLIPRRLSAESYDKDLVLKDSKIGSMFNTIYDNRNNPERDLHLKDVKRFFDIVCLGDEKNWKILFGYNFSSGSVHAEKGGIDKLAKEIGISRQYITIIRNKLYKRAIAIGSAPRWKDMVEAVMGKQDERIEGGGFTVGFGKQSHIDPSIMKEKARKNILFAV